MDDKTYYDPKSDSDIHLSSQQCSWMRSSRAQQQDVGSSKDLKITKSKRRQVLSKSKRAKMLRTEDSDHFDGNYHRSKEVRMEARNPSQKHYIKALNNPMNRICFAIGPAGTGKTLLAVLRAIRSLKNQDIKKIVITRPAVGVGKEDHGFLPGDLNEKMEPWILPILDIFSEYYTQHQIKSMMENKIIEVAPLMYMRGRTFKDCHIIADEMQNSTPEQMKLMLTRMGEGCKVTITGDLRQHDAKYQDNGMKDFIDRLTWNSPSIAICEFDHRDIERDPIVAEILAVYGDDSVEG